MGAAGSTGQAPADGTLAAVTHPDTDPAEPPAAPAEAPDVAPEIDDAELERLEADLATIEAAMDRVDAGDLDGAAVQMARLGDDEAPEGEAT